MTGLTFPSMAQISELRTQNKLGTRDTRNIHITSINLLFFPCLQLQPLPFSNATVRHCQKINLDGIQFGGGGVSRGALG